MGNFAKTEQTETNGKGRYEMTAENGSTRFGKFKDENALLNAYGALEAEFTRRSQKLKELERTLAKMQEKVEKPTAEKEEQSTTANLEKADENLSTDGINAVEPVLGNADGDGKQTAMLEREMLKTAEDAPTTGDSGEMAKVRGSEKVSASDGARTDGGFVGREIDLSKHNDREGVLSEDELYKRATENEGVRLKIIGEYLTSLKRPDAPLMKGGFGTIATPPLKAKTINEAGEMALSFLKK